MRGSHVESITVSPRWSTHCRKLKRFWKNYSHVRRIPDVILECRTSRITEGSKWGDKYNLSCTPPTWSSTPSNGTVLVQCAFITNDTKCISYFTKGGKSDSSHYDAVDNSHIEGWGNGLTLFWVPIWVQWLPENERQRWHWNCEPKQSYTGAKAYIWKLRLMTLDKVNFSIQT